MLDPPARPTPQEVDQTLEDRCSAPAPNTLTIHTFFSPKPPGLAPGRHLAEPPEPQRHTTESQGLLQERGQLIRHLTVPRTGSDRAGPGWVGNPFLNHKDRDPKGPL